MSHWVEIGFTCEHPVCAHVCSRTVRSFVEEIGAEAGLPATLVEDAGLVATELATNAADHAQGPYRVRVRVEDGMVIEFADRGARPGPSVSGPHRGRGLQIISAISDGVTLSREGDWVVRTVRIPAT